MHEISLVGHNSS